ncbi:MAG: hypothetical protein HC905_14550 [Bacteroidales bacterium]|nr:hypothetical protein [Bacteroidales bacterium]
MKRQLKNDAGIKERKYFRNQYFTIYQQNFQKSYFNFYFDPEFYHFKFMLFLKSLLISATLLNFSPFLKVEITPSSDNTWIKNILKQLDVTDVYWAIDKDENLCLTGYFMNSAMFGDVKLVSLGKFDVFVAKYSRNGDLLWIKQAGGSEPDLVKLIKTDSNNNIYITGYFTGISFFEDYIAHSKGRTDIFTAKYSAEGKLLWVKSEGAEIICEPNPVKRKEILRK